MDVKPPSIPYPHVDLEHGIRRDDFKDDKPTKVGSGRTMVYCGIAMFNLLILIIIVGLTQK